jgi:hypothetical protein
MITVYSYTIYDGLAGSRGGGSASLFAAKRNPKFYPDRPSTSLQRIYSKLSSNG